MNYLAIHDGHNASVALLENGKVTFAIQEERLSRVKNQGGFPNLALHDLLTRCQLSPTDIDNVVFVGYESATSITHRDVILDRYRRLAEQGVPRLPRWKKWLRPFLKGRMELAATRRRKLQQASRKQPLLALGIPEDRIRFIEHHTCHAASAAFGWGNAEPMVVVTSDSSGDHISASVSRFEKGRLTRLATIGVHDSIARLYAMVTYFMGMIPLEHEYKLMGLAPYGERLSQTQEIARGLSDCFTVGDSPLTFSRKSNVPSMRLYSDCLRNLLAYKPFHAVASGVQTFVEHHITDWIRRIMNTLDEDHLAVAGGLFMNVKLNQKILEMPEVSRFYACPSSGDESTVFGAAYQAYFLDTQIRPQPLSSLYLGGEFSSDDYHAALQKYVFQNKRIEVHYIEDIDSKIAELIAQNHIVARFSGPMEFGARALGNRSLLANPSHPDVATELNRLIKCRDFWMPFAPALIEPDTVFENPKEYRADSMMMAFQTRPEKRSQMRAVCHSYDGSCRPQVVDPNINPSFYRILKEVKQRTGSGIVLNTSFNLHGFPIVYTPEEALYVLDQSGLTFLALGNYLVRAWT